MAKHRRFLSEFWAALVIHGLAVLGAAAVSAGVVRLLSARIAALAPYAFLLSFGAGIVGGSIGLYAYYRFSKTRPRFDKLDFDFEVEEQLISYRYRENNTIKYVKRKKLCALKDGLRVYRDKYHWTGDKPPSSLISAVSTHTVRETGRHTVWNHYEIDLGRSLSKGEVVETELVWELDDTARRSVPFVSATVEEPTKRLSFDLVFPDQFRISTVTCTVLSGIGAKKPLTSISRTVGQNGAVSWTPEPPHPRLLHHYEVEWHF